MANVVVLSRPISEVDYSLIDGRIRSFSLRGVVLYDEAAGVAIDGWRDKLLAFVKAHRLDQDRDGRGLHAFVLRMQDDGLLPA